MVGDRKTIVLIMIEIEVVVLWVHPFLRYNLYYVVFYIDFSSI